MSVTSSPVEDRSLNHGVRNKINGAPPMSVNESLMLHVYPPMNHPRKKSTQNLLMVSKHKNANLIDYLEKFSKMRMHGSKKLKFKIKMTTYFFL